MEIYGSAVADKLDNNKGILRRRYYRQVCSASVHHFMVVIIIKIKIHQFIFLYYVAQLVNLTCFDCVLFFF